MFARLFHQPCPGCGSTRSVIALLHGDLHGFLANNFLGPVMALCLGVLVLQGLVSTARYGDFRGAGEGALGRVVRWGIFVVAGLELALWIARWFGAFGGPVAV